MGAEEPQEKLRLQPVMVLVTGHKDGNRVGWTCEDHLRGTVLSACDINSGNTSTTQEYLAVVGCEHIRGGCWDSQRFGGFFKFI